MLMRQLRSSWLSKHLPSPLGKGGQGYIENSGGDWGYFGVLRPNQSRRDGLSRFTNAETVHLIVSLNENNALRRRKLFGTRNTGDTPIVFAKIVKLKLDRV